MLLRPPETSVRVKGIFQLVGRKNQALSLRENEAFSLSRPQVPEGFPEELPKICVEVWRIVWTSMVVAMTREMVRIWVLSRSRPLQIPLALGQCP